MNEFNYHIDRSYREPYIIFATHQSYENETRYEILSHVRAIQIANCVEGYCVVLLVDTNSFAVIDIDNRNEIMHECATYDDAVNYVIENVNA